MIGLQAADMSGQASTLAQYNIGGVAIMSAPANISDGSILQFKKAAGSLGVPLLISTDEEGGFVQRFRVLGALPPPQEVAATMTQAQAEHMVNEQGSKMRTVGIDMVLGPLADVAPAGSYSPLGSRIFSSDPEVVKSYALAYVSGWQAAGLLPTLKHFPGMGSATGNTDYGPATTPPLNDLQQRDFIPYEGTMSSTGTAIMIGNQTVPGWFTGPASLSPTVDNYLRTNLGYKNNLVITDSLSAEAITAITTAPQAVVQAIVAGNDIALFVEPTGYTLDQDKTLIDQLHSALQQAVEQGTINKEQLEISVLRKLNAQQISACSL